MIKQQRIDVTKFNQNQIHPDFRSKIKDVEIKYEDKESKWIKVLPVKKITGKGFRLVHDGKVAFIIEGTDKNETTTMQEVEEFGTEQEAKNRVKALGLEVKKEKKAEMMI